MATTTTTFQRALTCSLLLSILMVTSSEAKDILVGGSTDSWKIPSSQSDSLNEWAGKARFLIGDSLVWKYDGKKDSVLQVTKADYLACNTTDPIEEYHDGNTKVELVRSGPFYFISGADGHCKMGQKVSVVVLSEKHGRYTGGFYLAPAPSPTEDGSAVAPTSNACNLGSGAAAAAVALAMVLGAAFL